MLHYNDKNTSYFGEKIANLMSHLVSRKHYPGTFPLNMLSVFAGEQGRFQLDRISFTSFSVTFLPLQVLWISDYCTIYGLLKYSGPVAFPLSHLKSYIRLHVMPFREGTAHGGFCKHNCMFQVALLLETGDGCGFHGPPATCCVFLHWAIIRPTEIWQMLLKIRFFSVQDMGKL